MSVCVCECVTHCLSEGGKLFCLGPAEDVEAVQERREQEKVRDQKRRQNMPLTTDVVKHLTI